MLTLQRLKEVLIYDKSTGLFKWRVSLGSRARKGCLAGTTNADGYILIGVDGTRYYGHHLAWLYHYGVWPQHIVDHENEIRNDNTISNLRKASHTQNMWNSSKARGKLPRGVSRNGKRFWARIYWNSKPIGLGNYKTVEEAHAAVIRASTRIRGEFSNYRRK